jgi:hypothetical protein
MNRDLTMAPLQGGEVIRAAMRKIISRWPITCVSCLRNYLADRAAADYSTCTWCGVRNAHVPLDELLEGSDGKIDGGAAEGDA